MITCEMVTRTIEVRQYSADIDSALSRGIRYQIENLGASMQTLNVNVELIHDAARGTRSFWAVC